MDQIYSLISGAIKNNEFFQGGFILAMMAAAFNYVRSLPSTIYYLCRKYLTIKVEFDKEDPIFRHFIEWIAETEIVKKKTRIRITTNKSKNSLKPVFSVGHGTFYIRHNGLNMMVTREKTEKGGGDNVSTDIAQMMSMEVFKIRVFRWDREKINNLINHVYESSNKKHKNKILLKHYDYDWRQKAKKTKRDLSNIILKKGQKKELLEDIEEFIKSEKWYVDKGIPYQRGYLLCGPPGTGKTSLIFSIASYLNYSINIIDLSDLKDRTLSNAFSTLSDKSIVVIEDIDSYFNGRDNITKNQSNIVTFSGLLNSLDGFSNAHGRILFITTNYEDKLDPALTRAGRIDKKIILGFCDAFQIKEMFLLFYPEETSLAEKFVSVCKGKKYSPSYIQEYLIQYKNKARESVDSFETYSKITKRHELSKVNIKPTQEERTMLIDEI